MVRQLVRSALAGSSPRLLATVGGLLLLGALLIGLSRPAQLHLNPAPQGQQVQALLEQLEGRLQRLEDAQHDLAAAAQLTALYVRGQANASEPLGAAPTRRLIDSTQWHINASDALQAWRASLFPRMSRMYTAAEAAKYRGRRWGSIQRVEPAGFSRYDLFNPVVRCPGGPLQRMGSAADGGKLLCGLDGLRARKACVVFSIGSNGQYDFEQAFLKETKCEVHTFDCHYQGGASQHKGRHFFHPVCLGGKTEQRRAGNATLEYKTLADLISMTGHSQVDMLKMDIEGFEYESLTGLRFKDSCRFPAQIAIELHWTALYQMTAFLRDRHSWQHMIWPMHDLSLAELAVFFEYLAELGYAVVSREDNPLSLPGTGCCSEFTLVRVEQPAGCG